MTMHRLIAALCFLLLLLPFLLSSLAIDTHALSIVQEYTFSDYDDYLRYLETISDSQGFISYEDLQSFGSYFDYRDNSANSDSMSKPITYSYYSFKDSNHFMIDLLVRYDSAVSIGDERYLRQTDGMTSMRHLESNKTGSILRGNLEYVYQNGALTNILWKVGSTTFALGGHHPLAEYPTDKEQTLLCDLLSIDEATANSALQALMKDIPGTIAPAHNLTAYLFRKLLWVGIAVIVVAGFFIIPPIVKKIRVRRTLKSIS